MTFLCDHLEVDTGAGSLDPPLGVWSPAGGDIFDLRSPPTPTGVLLPLEGVELRLFRDPRGVRILEPPDSGGVVFVVKLYFVPRPSWVSFSELVERVFELMPRPLYPDDEGVWLVETTPISPDVVVEECILATDLTSGVSREAL